VNDYSGVGAFYLPTGTEEQRQAFVAAQAPIPPPPPPTPPLPPEVQAQIAAGEMAQAAWGKHPACARAMTCDSAAPPASLRNLVEQFRRGQSQYRTIARRTAERPWEIASLATLGLAPVTAPSRISQRTLVGMGAVTVVA